MSPYPAGKHGPGHYVGSGGVIPPPIVADPVGTILVFQSEGFPGPFGSKQTYTTVNGTLFSLVNVPINPGRAEFYASEILNMCGMSSDDPPTLPQQVNFRTLDGATWTDESAAAGSIWNIFGSAQISELFFFEVAGLFAAFLKNSNQYFTSPDSVTWTHRTGNPWGAFNPDPNSYVSDGVNDYLAAGGQLFRSTDGINWTTVMPSISNGRIIFAGSNGIGNDRYWLFGGSAGSAGVESSLDGSDLSYSQNVAAEASLNAAGLIPFNNSFDVAYSNSLGGTFVLSFGNIAGTGSASNRLAVSTDGINWTNPGSEFIGNRVRYSATLSEFVKTQGDSSGGNLLRSGTGIGWTQHPYAAFGTLNFQFASSDLLISFR